MKYAGQFAIFSSALAAILSLLVASHSKPEMSTARHDRTRYSAPRLDNVALLLPLARTGANRENVPRCPSTTTVNVYGDGMVGDTQTLDAALNMQMYCYGQFGYDFCEGTVNFYDYQGGQEALLGTGTVDLNGCGRELDISTLPAGKHVIVATYEGNGQYLGSSGNETITIDKWASTTILTSNPNPSTDGQEVTLTATVNSPVGPTGSVTFVSGSKTMNSAPLINGVATLTTKKLPAGTLTITANYNGDTQSAKSSGTLTQVVN